MVPQPNGGAAMWYTILLAVLAVVGLVIGLCLVFEWWKPFKDDMGEKVPLSKKEKWVTVILTVLGILGLVTLFFSLNPRWFQGWAEKRRNKQVNGKIPSPAPAR